jgi:hypothetical protein
LTGPLRGPPPPLIPFGGWCAPDQGSQAGFRPVARLDDESGTQGAEIVLFG